MSSYAASSFSSNVLQVPHGLSMGKNEGGNSLRPPPKAAGADAAGEASLLMDEAEFGKRECREDRMDKVVSGSGGADEGSGGGGGGGGECLSLERRVSALCRCSSCCIKAASFKNLPVLV